MPTEFDPTRPIYLQIMESVIVSAVRGDHLPGSQLPSVRDMAATMGVNPNTMARAYQELERDGFLQTRRGEGSFVTGEAGRIDRERQRLANDARQRFTEQIRELALTRPQVKQLLKQIEEDTQP